MNLVLFEPGEIVLPLPRGDRRAMHVVDVLRRQPGDSFDVGIINGPRGKAIVQAIDGEKLSLAFAWGPEPPPLDAITVLAGLPRPQTARDLLRELATLGVERIHFVATERSDPNYARSRLWSSGEWRRLLIAGAEQAFDTRIPEITHGQPLRRALEELPAGSARLALDNYEASAPLADTAAPGPTPLVLALGGERGWSDGERALLRHHGFTLVALGARVLRVETAAIAALAILKASRGTL